MRISALWRLDPRRGLSTSTVRDGLLGDRVDEVNESAVRLFMTDRLNPRLAGQQDHEANRFRESRGRALARVCHETVTNSV